MAIGRLAVQPHVIDYVYAKALASRRPLGRKPNRFCSLDAINFDILLLDLSTGSIILEEVALFHGAVSLTDTIAILS